MTPNIDRAVSRSAVRLLAAMVVAASTTIAVNTESPVVVAAPTAFTVNPRVAPTASSVGAAGGGCTGTVRVTVTGFLFPGSPSVPFDQTLQPDVNGNWSVQFGMPATPA